MLLAAAVKPNMDRVNAQLDAANMAKDALNGDVDFGWRSTFSAAIKQLIWATYRIPIAHFSKSPVDRNSPT